ncbi:hypothetical protein E1295_44930 [Nonomuraea mesophila]|uniref:Uncharacterized protein n=1 Tax=Nonomuraea mesophila TaxID=2530382 RepID=A0A4R5E5M0_9ACTN|nr:hypothetical protein [Nonomuraea mesophila]TDE25137.1 hypothetical protein E1295_44930 [Nonomuraea mesophila]
MHHKNSFVQRLVLLLATLVCVGGIHVLPAHADTDLGCPGGATSADGAIAAEFSRQLTGKMRGAIWAGNIACARVIVQTTKSRNLSLRAASIAITTAIVESSIRNLDYGDSSSVGLYQQIADWGSFAQRTNPVWATNAFLGAMLESYPGGSWAGRPIGEVCQTVQRSGYPERYQPEAADGIRIATRLWGESSGPRVGRVFWNMRSPSGAWTGARVSDQGPVGSVAYAAGPDGSLHQFTLAGGRVHLNTRRADGSWTGARVTDQGPVSAVAAAAGPGGEVYQLTLAGGRVHLNIRRADGSWTGARVTDQGPVSAVAAAVAPNGFFFQMTLTGGRVHVNIRHPNGAWDGAKVTDQGPVSAIAAAAGVNNELHQLTLAGGKVHLNTRHGNGAWSGARVTDQGPVSAVAAAAGPQGLHQITLSAGRAFHNLRRTDGSWTGARIFDDNGHLFAIAAGCNISSGNLHIATMTP